MTREELQDSYGIEVKDCYGELHDYIKWLEDKILSLPPAEGAETILKLIDELTIGIMFEYQRDEDKDSGGYLESPGNEWISKLCLIHDKLAAQQQPTAEGAEEKTVDDCFREALEESPYGILTYETALETARKFATLHAQRIADKMVSERLREELIAYKTYENIFDNKFTTVEDLIDEYLKTR